VGIVNILEEITVNILVEMTETTVDEIKTNQTQKTATTEEENIIQEAVARRTKEETIMKEVDPSRPTTTSETEEELEDQNQKTKT
jgi:hypothetical protein